MGIGLNWEARKVRSGKCFRFQRGHNNNKAATISLEDGDGEASSLEHDSRAKLEAHAGWRATIKVGGFVIALVLIINISLLIYAYTRGSIDDAPVANGDIAIFMGDCDTANRIKTGSHVAINVLGTLLLVTGGATMQILSAPTRSDIDAAHTKGIWMDVGLLSVRNLQRSRVILWLFLAISSIPIHLLYNSVIFSTINANQTLSILVTRDFVTNMTCTPGYMQDLINRTAPYPNSGWGASESGGQTSQAMESDQRENLMNSTVIDALAQIEGAARSKNLITLDPNTCMDEFNSEIVSKYRNVVLVTTLLNQNQTIIDMLVTSTFNYPPWTCNSLERSYKNTTDYLRACDGENIPMEGQVATTESMLGQEATIDYKTTQESVPIISPPQAGYFNLDHCLVQHDEGKCTVQVYPALLVIVIVANAVKLVIVIYTAYFSKFRSLVTVGDAVVSFMEKPDTSTLGIGSVSKQTIANSRINSKHRATRTKQSNKEHYGSWEDIRLRWFSATSKTHWIFVMTLCLITLIIGGFMMSQAGGTYTLALSISVGFGVTNGNYIVNNQVQNVDQVNVVLANTPQIIISCIYVLYNGLLTSMLLSAEWMDYGTEAKGVRVTPPVRGNQRSTYYLQLPYRYSLPVMTLMATLHWLLSESLFLAHIDSYSISGEIMDDMRLDAVGYSASAIIAAFCLGSIIVLIPLALGFRKYPAGIPLVGSCSLAIAAACHPPADEPVDGSEKPLKYGVLREVGSTDLPRVGFTSLGDVEPLVKGQSYDASVCTYALRCGKHLECCLRSRALPKAPLSPDD